MPVRSALTSAVAQVAWPTLTNSSNQCEVCLPEDNGVSCGPVNYCTGALGWPQARAQTSCLTSPPTQHTQPNLPLLYSSMVQLPPPLAAFKSFPLFTTMPRTSFIMIPSSLTRSSLARSSYSSLDQPPTHSSPPRLLPRCFAPRPPPKPAPLHPSYPTK